MRPKKNITVERINETDYANIYSVYEDGKLVGTIEQRLAGRDCGTYPTSWVVWHTNRDILRLFFQCQTWGTNTEHRHWELVA